MLKKFMSVFAFIVSVFAVGANAAVTFSDGSFSGTFDLAPYYSAVGIIIGAIAIVAAIGLALRQFRRVG